MTSHREFYRSLIYISNGEILLALDRLDAQLNANERDAFQRFLGDCRRAAESAESLRLAWKDPSRAQFVEGADNADQAFDKATTQFFRLLSAHADAEGLPAAEPAARLRDALFPRGPAAVTQAKYADEVAQSKAMREVLAARAADVDAVPGAALFAASFGEAADALAAIVSQTREDAVSHKEMQLANYAANERLLELCCAITASNPGTDPDGGARREVILAPVRAIVEATRRRYRERPSEDATD